MFFSMIMTLLYLNSKTNHWFLAKIMISPDFKGYFSWFTDFVEPHQLQCCCAESYYHKICKMSFSLKSWERNNIPLFCDPVLQKLVSSLPKGWYFLAWKILSFHKKEVCMGQSIQEWTRRNLWRLSSTNFTWSNLEYFDPHLGLFSFPLFHHTIFHWSFFASEQILYENLKFSETCQCFILVKQN